MAAMCRLPDEIREKVIGENVVEEQHISSIIDKLMNPLLQLKHEEFNQNNLLLHLDKVPDKKWPKPQPHRRKTLSYKERRMLGLYSVGRYSLQYKDLIPLNSLWKDYMDNYINLKELMEKKEDKDDDFYQQIGVKLYRADYHGAELTVKRSLCPGYVGKSGIVAMETKNCFVLVGKDNVTRKIPKNSCEFSFVIGELQLSFFGKNFVSRPADRSSKKLKTIYMPTL